MGVAMGSPDKNRKALGSQEGNISNCTIGDYTGCTAVFHAGYKDIAEDTGICVTPGIYHQHIPFTHPVVLGLAGDRARRQRLGGRARRRALSQFTGSGAGKELNALLMRTLGLARRESTAVVPETTQIGAHFPARSE